MGLKAHSLAASLPAGAGNRPNGHGPTGRITDMGALAWTMMGLALWHFTIFIPDRFWAGIVGAFLGSVLGAILFGFAINGFTVPGQDDTTVATVLECIPGSILGVGLVWLIGDRSLRKRETGLAGLPAE